MRGARLLLLAASLLPALVGAQEAPSLPLMVGSGPNNSFSVPIQTLLFFTALSFLPAVLLMMTGFTRIVIVLSLMRQALEPGKEPEIVPADPASEPPPLETDDSAGYNENQNDAMDAIIQKETK